MAKNVGGRKGKEAEREHIGFRARPDLKRRLEAAARASTRSLSQEIELRLEQSLGFGAQMVLSRGDTWAPAYFDGNTLVFLLGWDSPPELVAISMKPDQVTKLREYFGGGEE
jgi:hypothetical protein